MGRKLIRRLPIEKETERGASRNPRKAHVAIVIAQHLLLWSSGYVVASTAYLVHTEAITKDVKPVAVIMMFTGCASLLSICLCNATAWRSTRLPGRSFLTSPACLQSLSKHVLRLVVTAWIVASALAIAFTAARRPVCLMSERARLHSPAIDVGMQCMIQRASIAASLFAMITSITLFVFLLKTTDPYLAHLAGINEPQPLIPFTLPYKTADRPMFSEMSFKCRSTSSFSSYTLVDPSEDTLYNLYPTRPEKAYGLGIYAPKTSAATSFLTRMPSLKKIRSQASLGHRPLQSSPLPPLPVYVPEKYKSMPAMQKPLVPPRRAYTLKRRGSRGTLRVVPRSPATIETSEKSQTVAPNRKPSKESLSSVYSRSVSGAEPPERPGTRPEALQEHGSNLSSCSTSTVRRSPPLSGLRNASDPFSIARQPPQAQQQQKHRFPAQPASRRVPTHARLPLTRAVSTFGNVQDWVARGGGDARNLPVQRSGSWAERCNLPPLPIQKTRGNRFDTHSS